MGRTVGHTLGCQLPNSCLWSGVTSGNTFEFSTSSPQLLRHLSASPVISSAGLTVLQSTPAGPRHAPQYLHNKLVNGSYRSKNCVRCLIENRCLIQAAAFRSTLITKESASTTQPGIAASSPPTTAPPGHHQAINRPSTAPPPASACKMLPDEAVWRLLLDQLWPQPDEQLLCSLLCTSAATAHLELCAGKAAMRIRSEFCYHTTKQFAAARAFVRCWLAKHARLLGQLAVCGDQLQYVVAGLCDAAGVPFMANSPQQSSRQADSTAAAPAPAAEAQGLAAFPGSAPLLQELLPPARPLHLTSLQLQPTYGCRGGRACMLHVLRACPRLTQLQLHMGASRNSHAHLLQLTIATLQDLQDHSVTALYVFKLRAHCCQGVLYKNRK